MEQGTITLPYIPLSDVVVYPHNEVVLTFGKTESKAAVDAALKGGKQVVLFTKNTQLGNLYQVGTLCQLDKTLTEGGEINALVRGISRVKLIGFVEGSVAPLAQVMQLPTDFEASEELEALGKHLTEQFRTAVSLGKSVEFMHFMRLVSGVSAVELGDQIAPTLNCSLVVKQKILEEMDLIKRLYLINDHLSREIKVLEIEKNIASKTQQKFSKSMREAVLRERMNTIKQELGEIDELGNEHDELYEQFDRLVMDKAQKAKVKKELDRLDRMSPNNSEYHYIRTWLETVFDLPWGKVSRSSSSLKTAEETLNKEHYGLEEIKERILEYLAVMKLKQKIIGSQVALPTILCFVGPPGVGKTSLGRSIAKSLRRKFVKVSLGGIRDEAEIRGHRKTYVGAMPGRIIEGLKTAGTSNPVFMLDEIDKIGADYKGDPSAALLEALDPEQNKAFSDHYLEIDFDLSAVMFIATANTLDTIPSALRDRLEIIRFAGYTPLEKFHIAKNHLLSKIIEKNALTSKDLHLKDMVIKQIIKDYTRESGVRGLERELSKIARKVARQKTKSKKEITITPTNLSSYLGPTKYLSTIAEKKNPIGQATGLAWTSVGGEILFVEVATMPGSGKLTITGQLGDVMKESASAAFTYVRSHYKDFGLKPYFYKKIDLHIHVPEGAVPKDGPSAGVTMTTSIVSALTRKPVKRDLGMTGEVTLRGKVLEIGGLKEKSIAALSAGLKEVIIPSANLKDIKKLPIEVTNKLIFHPVSTVQEVLDTAFAKSR